MSALVCSLSGAPLVNPAVCSKTGHLYEHSTILHYISVHGKCPHTGASLSASDLVILANKNTAVLPGQQSVSTLA